MSNTVPSPVGGRRQANFREKILLGGSRRSECPPDLFDRRRQYRNGNFRLLWSAVKGRGGYSNLREKMIVGGAGGPGALQTSPPARKRKSVDTNPHAALAGLTLPGLARQLLNRRSGSARLRSTASQLLLAALRNAKQSSHMRSRR